MAANQTAARLKNTAESDILRTSREQRCVRLGRAGKEVVAGSVMTMKKVTIYTDGACSGNPGPGGWGCVLIFGEHRLERSGFEADTTNNRMELLAAAEGLRALKEPCEVDLFTDSTYLCNAFEEGWIENWKRNGWKTKAKTDVANQDLWNELLALGRKHVVRYHKVKGHADNPMNNLCDKLATSEIRRHARGPTD